MSDVGVAAIMAAHTRHADAHRRHHLSKVEHAARVAAAHAAAHAEYTEHDLPSGAERGDGSAVNG